MDVGGVVPDAGRLGGGPSKTIIAADEHEPLDEALDRAELVGDVEDGDAQLAVESVEELAERLLRLGVDAGRRLVEHEQRRLARERLGDERTLLLTAGERLSGGQRTVESPTRSIASATIVAVARGEAARAGRRSASRPAATTSSTVDGRVDAELGALREVAERRAPREARAAGSPKRRDLDRGRAARGRATSRTSVVLPPPFGPAIATSSPALDLAGRRL